MYLDDSILYAWWWWAVVAVGLTVVVVFPSDKTPNSPAYRLRENALKPLARIVGLQPKDGLGLLDCYICFGVWAGAGVGLIGAAWCGWPLAVLLACGVPAFFYGMRTLGRMMH